MKNKRYTVQEYAELNNTNRMKIYRLIKSNKLEIDEDKKGNILVIDNKWNQKVLS